MRSSWIVLLLFVVGCSQTANPCPPGHRVDRHEDRCLPPLGDAATDLDAGQAEAQAPGADEPDLAPTIDAGHDDAQASRDAETDADGEVSADGEVEPACSSADVDAWRTAHLRPGLVQLVFDCYVTCQQESACTIKCVNDSAGLAECKDCMAEQSTCTLELCGAACSVSPSDDMCLACLCESDCIGKFERCAGRELALCSDELFGPELPPDSAPLSAPFLLRHKSATGGLRASPLAAVEGKLWPTTATFQYARYFDHLVAFPLGGRDYVLHAKSECHGGPCSARISPVLADGRFARPAYQAVWNEGFDELDAFAIDGVMYLSRYKSGALALGADAAGTLWVDRVTSSAEGTAVQLTTALRGQLTASAGAPYRTLNRCRLPGPRTCWHTHRPAASCCSYAPRQAKTACSWCQSASRSAGRAAGICWRHCA